VCDGDGEPLINILYDVLILRQWARDNEGTLGLVAQTFDEATQTTPTPTPTRSLLRLAA
jgi:hypothetical protein